jgi:hypothetical protein
VLSRVQYRPRVNSCLAVGRGPRGVVLSLAWARRQGYWRLVARPLSMGGDESLLELGFGVRRAKCAQHAVQVFLLAGRVPTRGRIV